MERKRPLRPSAATAPALHTGDVMHVGLWDYLTYFWPALDAAAAADATLPNATSLRWGIAVHPYDAGDPRGNLSSSGIYTFATLSEMVADVQCGWLTQYGGVPAAECGSWPQTQMYASEQGWPYNNVTMTKALQARNICYAHELSLAQGVWAVTHNFAQGAGPSSQGDAGDFSLIPYLPLVAANLSNGPGHPTYDAYTATAPGTWGVSAAHYCCTEWATGCPQEF
jgi:hypothetical protein